MYFSKDISWWIILLIVIFSITIIASVVVIWFKRNSCTKLIRYHVHQNNSGKFGNEFIIRKNFIFVSFTTFIRKLIVVF